jgi:hypothetical protein
MPFWTALCCLFSPANAETGEKKIFEMFYSRSLSPPHLPKNPHNHTASILEETWDKQRPMQTETHALHLNRYGDQGC